MKNNAVIKTTTGIALWCLASVLQAGGPPLKLNIEAPSGNDNMALLSESGWPLIIKMEISDEDSLGYFIKPDFPNLDSQGILVIDDEDECLSFLPRNYSDACSSAAPEFVWPANETYMEFYAGTDNPGSDGYGIGADDDIPGLVVISDMGVGKVFEPGFMLPAKKGVRNLAGLVNSVAYELSNADDGKSKGKKPKKGKDKKKEATPEYHSTFWVSTIFQRDVIRPIVQLDNCVGEIDDLSWPPSCGNGDQLWRVDGGPVEWVKDTLGYNAGGGISSVIDIATADLMNLLSYKITVFMVSGTAPDSLFDEDGDGDVDSKDAKLAGYTVISNEDHVEFLLLSETICFGGGGGGFYADLDGNGEVGETDNTCPGGPGDISRPPR